MKAELDQKIYALEKERDNRYRLETEYENQGHKLEEIMKVKKSSVFATCSGFVAHRNLLRRIRCEKEYLVRICIISFSLSNFVVIWKLPPLFRSLLYAFYLWKSRFAYIMVSV